MRTTACSLLDSDGNPLENKYCKGFSEGFDNTMEFLGKRIAEKVKNDQNNPICSLLDSPGPCVLDAGPCPELVKINLFVPENWGVVGRIIKKLSSPSASVNCCDEDAMNDWLDDNVRSTFWDMEVVDEENESDSCPRETISLGSTTGADEAWTTFRGKFRNIACAFGSHCEGINRTVDPNCGSTDGNTNISAMSDVYDRLCNTMNNEDTQWTDKITSEIIDNKLCQYCQYCGIVNEEVYNEMKFANNEKAFCNAGEFGTSVQSDNGKINKSFSDVNFCNSCNSINCACASPQAGDACDTSEDEHVSNCEEAGESSTVGDAIPEEWQDNWDEFKECKKQNILHKSKGDVGDDGPNRWDRELVGVGNERCADDEYGTGNCGTNQPFRNMCKELIRIMENEQNKIALIASSLIFDSGLMGYLFRDQCADQCCTKSGVDCQRPPFLEDYRPVGIIRSAMDCDQVFRKVETDDEGIPLGPRFVDTASEACICQMCEGQNWSPEVPARLTCERCQEAMSIPGESPVSREEFNEKTSSPKRLLQEIKTCIQCPLLGNLKRGFWEGGEWRECLSAGTPNVLACPCEYQDNICAVGAGVPDAATDAECKDNPKWGDEFDPGNHTICYNTCKYTMADGSMPPGGGDLSRCECPPKEDPGAPGKCARGKGCTDYSRNAVFVNQEVPPASEQDRKTSHGECWELFCPTMETQDPLVSTSTSACAGCDQGANINTTFPPYLVTCDSNQDCPRDRYCCPTGFCGSTDEECFENIFLNRNHREELPPDMDSI